MSSHFLSSHHASGHHASAHFGRTIIVPPVVPEGPVFPPGTGADIDALTRRRIMEEEELLLLVIKAFLTLKDRE